MQSLPLSSQPSYRGGTLVRPTRTALAWLATSVLVLSITLTPQTGATEERRCCDPPFVSGLLDLRLSNDYLTPRGLIVENSGVVAQPVLLLFFNLYEGEGPLSNVTATLGMFNSVHSKQRDPQNVSSTPNWNEMDLISSLSATLLKDWKFTFGYEYWVSPIDAFASSSHIELRFAYSDHFLKSLMPNMPGTLSINPYFNIFVELHNKTVVSTTSESHYFELGAVPRYVFNGYPLTIELPTYLTFPGDHFYSENSTLGVFGTGVKVTAPLTFIRPRYGKWSVHTDLIYKHLINDGIVAGNLLLPPHAETRNPVQVVGGLTLYF